jgi:hypothetical protein
MIKRLIFLVVVQILVSGCGPQTSIPANATEQPSLNMPVNVTQNPATEVPAPSGSNENDQCGNPYYPVVNGAEWTYTGPTGQFTHSLATGDNGAFTDTVKSGENTFVIQGLCLEGGDINLLDVPGNQKMDFTIDSTFTAVGYETVTVPAGTFNALKVEESSDMGGPEPTIINLWYAQNVGSIKTEIKMGDQTLVNELVSYNIP